jgi:hypothetical protein
MLSLSELSWQAIMNSKARLKARLCGLSDWIGKLQDSG